MSASDAQCGLGLYFVLESSFFVVLHGCRFTRLFPDSGL